MDSTGWMLLVLATLIFAGVALLLRSRVKSPPMREAAPAKPRDRRLGPRRIKASRREAFRMGQDDTDRRSGEDRRHREPGWNDGVDKR